MLWYVNKNNKISLFTLSDYWYVYISDMNIRYNGKVTFRFSDDKYSYSLKTFFDIKTRMYDIVIPVNSRSKVGDSIDDIVIPDDADEGWLFQMDTLYDITCIESLLDDDFVGYTFEQIKGSRS